MLSAGFDGMVVQEPDIFDSTAISASHHLPPVRPVDDLKLKAGNRHREYVSLAHLAVHAVGVSPDWFAEEMYRSLHRNGSDFLEELPIPVIQRTSSFSAFPSLLETDIPLNAEIGERFSVLHVRDAVEGMRCGSEMECQRLFLSGERD